MEASKKISYEELKTVADQLQGQVEKYRDQYRRLVEEYNKAMEMVMGKRLDALFKVVENRAVFSEDFVNETINSIEGMLRIPEAKDEPDTAEIQEA